MFRKIFPLLLICIFIALVLGNGGNTHAQDDPQLLHILGRGTAQTIAWSPTEELLAVGGSRGITIYGGNLQVTNTLTSPWGGINEIIWSPDGTKIAGGSTFFIGIWDIQTQNLDHIISADFGKSLAWSPDGQYLAGVRWDTVKIIDIASEQVIVTMQLDDVVLSVAWPLDSSQLIINTQDGVLQEWEISQQSTHRIMESVEPHFYGLAHKPASNHIASFDNDGQIYIWDAATGNILHEFSTQRHLAKLIWHTNRQGILSVDEHGQVEYWDLSLGQVPQSIVIIEASPDTLYREITLSASGEQLASLEVTRNVPNEHFIVDIFDLATRELVLSLVDYSDRISSLSWSPDGSHLASSSTDAYLRVWNTETGSLLIRAPFFPWTKLVWSEDWRRVTGFNENGEIQSIWEWSIPINELPSIVSSVSLNTLAELQQAEIMENFKSFALLWVNSATQLVDVSFKGLIRDWHEDEFTGEWVALQSYSSDIALVYAAAVNPTMSMIALAGVDEENKTILQTISLETGAITTVFQNEPYGILALAWNQDGTLLASGGPNSVTLWDLSVASVPIKILSSPINTERIRALRWHPTQATILAGGGKDVWIWDVQNTEPLFYLETQQYVTDFAWSPDGSKLASGGQDGSIWVWEVPLD